MSTSLKWAPHLEQRGTWPASGRHILAQHDADSIVVYQAYRAEIAEWAVANQAFGGPWSFERMSWIKPNFLWMMYRSGWATKPGQENVLAIRITREGFDTVLERSLESSHHPDVCGLDYAAWRQAGKRADVRLQWDPDHTPTGEKTTRRAVQLGLRGETLRSFATEWVLSITNIADDVARQRSVLERGGELLTPAETLYTPASERIADQIRLQTARS